MMRCDNNCISSLSANIALLIGVTIGFVQGVIAATTPTGLATFVIPVSLSISIIPTDFYLLNCYI